MFRDLNAAVFDEQTKKALGVLAKMKLDLDEYKKKENAIQSVIQQRERALTLLLEFITEIVPDYIELLEADRKRAYADGHQKGYQECEAIYVWKPDRLDRENYRTYSIMKLKQEMPELF